MSRLLRHLLDTCYKVDTIKNEYGDYVYKATISLKCRFRYNQDIRVATGSNEIKDSDAQLWLYPDVDVNNGDIILYQNVYYQVEEIIKAQKLGKTRVEFIKCRLTIKDIMIS